MTNIGKVLMMLSLGTYVATAWSQAPAPLNLIENGGFESGNFNGWDQYGANEALLTVTNDKMQAYSGNCYLRFSKKSGEAWGFIWRRMDGLFTHGDTVEVSAWVRRVAGEYAGPYLAVNIKKRNTFEFVEGKSVKAALDDRWQKLTVSYVIPGTNTLPDLGAVHIEINIGSETVGNTNLVYIDEVTVSRK